MQPAHLQAKAHELEQLASGILGVHPNQNNDGEAFRQKCEVELMNRRNNLEHVFALVSLFEMYSNNPQKMSFALFSAIELKNIFMDHYSTWVEMGTTQLMQSLSQLRNEILRLYVNVQSKKLSQLLKGCLEIFIKQEYFPGCWPDLLQQVLQGMGQGNKIVRIRLLSVLHRLTMKYSQETRSDQLYLEINMVVETIHDMVLEAMQMFLQLLGSGNANETNVNSLRFLLQIFYNCIFQDIHPKIEDNITRWVEILRSILNKDFEGFVLKALPQTEEGMTYFYNLKGECIKVILLLNNKYSEDFKEYLNAFTEEIWKNCLEPGPKANKKLVMYSIKYFKNFASNKNYIALFQSKMFEIVSRLLIPGFSFKDEDWQLFENEPDSFGEVAMRLHSRGVNTEREIAQDFAQNLGRFHCESVFAVLGQISQGFSNETTGALNFTQILERLVYINLFMYASTLTTNPREGVQSILCSAEVVSHCFDSIICPSVNSASQSSPENISLQELFVLSHCVRFASLMRYFVPLNKNLEMVQYLLGKGYHLQSDRPGVASFRNCFFTWANNMLNLKEYTVVNHLNLDQTGMTFYRKYYMSTRKLGIKINRRSFQVQNNHPLLGALVQLLYAIFTGPQAEINEQLMLVFRSCLQRLGPNVISNIEPLIKVYRQLFMALTENKIMMNFGNINEIFESFTALIIQSSAQPAAITSLIPALQLLPPLFSKNLREMHSLLVQVFSLVVSKFFVDVAPKLSSGAVGAKAANPQTSQAFQQAGLQIIVNSVLDVNNYQGEMISLSDIFLHFIAECAAFSPNLVESEWQRIEIILKHLLSQKMHRSVMAFLKDLLLARVNSQKMFHFVVEYMGSMVSSSATGLGTVIETQFFFKEMTFFLVLFLHIYGIESLVSVFAQFKAVPLLQAFFTSEPFVEFVSKFAGSQHRRYLNLMLAKFLFDDPTKTVNGLGINVFRSVLNAVLENLYLRKFDFKNLRMARTQTRKYTRKLKNSSNNSYSVIYKFKELKRPFQLHVAEFLKEIAKMPGTPNQLFKQKTSEFLASPNVKAEEFIEEKYGKLFVQ